MKFKKYIAPEVVSKMVNYIYTINIGNEWYIKSDYPVTTKIMISHSELGSTAGFGVLNIGSSECYITGALSPGETGLSIYGIGFTKNEADILALQECEDDAYIYRIKHD